MSIYLPIYLSIYLSICLSVYLSICLSVYLSTWKRNNPARLPQYLNLTTSKTQQFCETSSTVALDNIKNEAILRDFLNYSKLTTSKTKRFCEPSFKNGRLSAELTASYQCVLRFFHSICSNYCACHEKLMPGHIRIRSDAPVTQNHLIEPTDLMLQNATPFRKSAPGPPNISDDAPATRHASCQILCKCPTLAIVFGNAPFFFGTRMLSQSSPRFSSAPSVNLREAQHSDTENQSEVETQNFKARSTLCFDGSAWGRREKM